MKTIKTVLLSLLTACVLMSAAFADVALVPAIVTFTAVPIIFIAILLIVVVLIVRSVRRVKTQNGAAEKKTPPADACMDPNAENDRAKKTDWDHMDPWDLDRK